RRGGGARRPGAGRGRGPRPGAGRRPPPEPVIVDGSTPEPRSRTRRSNEPPPRIDGVSRPTEGGVVSFSQKRNVNPPAERRLFVSKTRSYVPGAGLKTPTAGTSSKKVGRYGFSRT